MEEGYFFLSTVALSVPGPVRGSKALATLVSELMGRAGAQPAGLTGFTLIRLRFWFSKPIPSAVWSAFSSSITLIKTSFKTPLWLIPPNYCLLLLNSAQFRVLWAHFQFYSLLPPLAPSPVLFLSRHKCLHTFPHFLKKLFSTLSGPCFFFISPWWLYYS